jgi:cyclophilin family peptidyl-prolyl cis-trans isomerase
MILHVVEQGTSEFFFSLEDHPEWNGSFSVWGKVFLFLLFTFLVLC